MVLEAKLEPIPFLTRRFWCGETEVHKDFGREKLVKGSLRRA
jgi:hypothetical protein